MLFKTGYKMKGYRVLLLALLMVFSGLLFEGFAQGPPPWAPAHGYRAKARYTYFPSLGFYFDSRGGFYLFRESGVWVRKSTLPSKYKNYNWSKYRYEEFEWENDRCWDKHHGKSNGKSNGKGNSSGKSNGKGKSKGKS
jgi:hypothetical protein